MDEATSSCRRDTRAPAMRGQLPLTTPGAGQGPLSFRGTQSLTGTCLQPCEILSLELSPAEPGLLTHRCSEIMNGAFFFFVSKTTAL